MKIDFKFIIITIVFLINLACFAENVSIEKARTVAENLFSEKMPNPQKDLIFGEEFIISENGIVTYYVFNINNGFLIVSAEDVVYPVLAYSFHANYTGNNFPPAFETWIDQYHKQILFASNQNLKATEKVKTIWEKYTSKHVVPKTEITSVEPMLQTTWSQGCYYNSQFPVDTAAPCGYLWTGCVATAMGQIMKYYNYPKNGIGSFGYNSSYGWVEADFENTEYDWATMKNHLNDENDPVAELLFHAAVSVSSQFFPNGTGAYDFDARDALVDYFNYKNEAQFLWRDSYQGEWKAMLRNELDEARPFIYGGVDSETYAGHTLVCDGYQDTSFFHFNWGWNGVYNGYFYIDSLVAGGNYFDFQHDAIVGISPDITGAIVTYPPENLLAEVDFKDVSLSWDHASNQSSMELLGYNVYRNDSLLTESVLNGLSYVDTEVPAGSFEYKVQSVFIGNGNGPYVLTEAYVSAIEDQYLNSFAIYPNPAYDCINIKLQESNAGIMNCYILDMNGQIVCSQQLKVTSSCNIRMEIPFIKSGIYLLQIENESILYSRKILIR